MKKAALTIWIFAAFSLLTGCAWQGETLSDENWGRSFETAKFNQTLNPDAGKNLEPVMGLDGTASNNNVESYQNSFKGHKKEPTVNILKLQ